MGKKVYIRKDEYDYYEVDEVYEGDVFFDAWSIIWHDFERYNFDERALWSFEEMKQKYLEFEKEWLEIEPNFGLYSDRDPDTGLLV